MVIAWMLDNNTTNWTHGLRFVQFAKNSSLNSGIGLTPFKAMFGQDAQVGLESTTLPPEIMELVHTEEDLLRLAEQEQTPVFDSELENDPSPNSVAPQETVSSQITVCTQESVSSNEVMSS